jgi:uncharacterized membrane protein
MNDERHTRCVRVLGRTMIAVGCAVAAVTADAAERPASERATYAKVQPLLQRNCSMCHSQEPSLPFYRKPPDGVTFDSPEDLQRFAARVLEVATRSDQMPPGNMTGMTEAERKMLAAAIEAQWPLLRKPN